MKQALRTLIIGTAVSVFSLGAYAQSTSTTPPSPSTPKMTGTTETGSDYDAAKAACEMKTGMARADCEAALARGVTEKGGAATSPGSKSGNAGGMSGLTGGAEGAPTRSGSSAGGDSDSASGQAK